MRVSLLQTTSRLCTCSSRTTTLKHTPSSLPLSSCLNASSSSAGVSRTYSSSGLSFAARSSKEAGLAGSNSSPSTVLRAIRRGQSHDGRGVGRPRAFHSSSHVSHNPVSRPAPGTGFKVHFKDSKGTVLKTIEANEGDSLLDLAHEHDIDLEGACEGSIACSTCHVILEPEVYDLLAEPEDEENDMLDMAFGLTDTSRLGCQVILKPELDGMSVTLPSATRNMFVDGKAPTKH